MAMDRGEFGPLDIRIGFLDKKTRPLLFCCFYRLIRLIKHGSYPVDGHTDLWGEPVTEDDDRWFVRGINSLYLLVVSDVQAICAETGLVLFKIYGTGVTGKFDTGMLTFSIAHGAGKVTGGYLTKASGA